MKRSLLVLLCIASACVPPKGTQVVDIGDGEATDPTGGIVDALASIMTVSRQTGVVADGVDAVDISVTLTTLAGLPAQTTNVALESNNSACAFTPSALVTNAAGQASAQLKCTNFGRIAVRAVVDPAGLRTVLFATLDIEFVQPPVATLHITPSTLTPVERARFDLEIEARDAFGRIAVNESGQVVVSIGADVTERGVNIHGRASVTLANGRARISDVWLDRAGTFRLAVASANPAIQAGISDELVVSAASFSARNVGLDGGSIYDLAADSVVPGVFYASTVTDPIYTIGLGAGHTFVSRDGGSTWRSISEGLPQYQVGFISSPGLRANEMFAYQYKHPLAAIGGGLYHTEDAGSSWTRVNDLRVDKMFIARNRTQIALELNVEGPLLSKDDGKTFTNVSEGLPRIDRYTTGTPVCFGELGGKLILWTRDDTDFLNVPKLYQRNEDVWQELSVTGLPETFNLSDSSLVKSGDSLVVVSDGHVYCSAGASPAFSLCETGIADPIEQLPLPGEVLYARAAGALYRSTSPKDGWTRVGNATGTRTDLIAQPAQPNVVLARGDGGVIRSSDGGISFAESDRGLHGSSVYAVRSTLYMGTEIIIAMTSEKIYRSNNQGVSWTPVYDLNGFVPYQLEALPDGTFLALASKSGPGGSPRWYRSSPGGETFSLQTTTAGTITRFAVDTSVVGSPRLIALTYDTAYLMNLDGTAPVQVQTEVTHLAAGSFGYALLRDIAGVTYLQTNLASDGYLSVSRDLGRSAPSFFAGNDRAQDACLVAFAPGVLESYTTNTATTPSLAAAFPTTTRITRLEGGILSSGGLPGRIVSAGRLFFNYSAFTPQGEANVYTIGDDVGDFSNVKDFALSKAPTTSVTMFVGTIGGVYVGKY